MPEFCQNAPIVLETDEFGERVDGEELGGLGVVAGSQDAADGAAQIDRQVRALARIVGRVENVEEGEDLHFQAALLPCLAESRLLGRFEVFLVSRRERPMAAVGLDLALHEAHFFALHHDGARGRRGIRVEDELAPGAARPLVPLNVGGFERASAERAVPSLGFPHATDSNSSTSVAALAGLSSLPRDMKRIVLLGSTGSVGESTLRLVEEQRSQFCVVGLAAHRNARGVLEQARRFEVGVVALSEPAAADEARALAGPVGPRVLGGPNAPVELLGAVPFDLAVHAITGAAGLPASYDCLRQGVPLALANKESLVIAGELLMGLARRSGAPILPVDSEHSAVYQCVRHEPSSAIRRIYLTASGGPFRDRPLDTFDRVTREEALRHPNWSMGERITIGSATMMNKAFEIIEAHHLFGLRADQITVLIHRQSIVHSMVGFEDGSMMAQLGVPDMRVPIQVALHHPARGRFAFEPFEPQKFASLTFSEPERARYPALALGERCLVLGGTSGAILNAADEVATARFLAGEIAFPEIALLCADALDRVAVSDGDSLEAIWDSDARARAFARAWRSSYASAR